MYTRRSRKNSKRQKTLGGKGNCQGQLPLSTTYSFSPLSPRRNRATYRLQQSKDHREVTRRNCFIATTKSSSTDFRCEDQEKSYPRHVHFPLSLSLSFIHSLCLSLSGWRRSSSWNGSRESTGQHTGSGKKRENGYVQEEEKTRLFLKNKSINEHFFPPDSRLVLEKINLILKIRNFHSVIIPAPIKIYLCTLTFQQDYKLQ